MLHGDMKLSIVGIDAIFYKPMGAFHPLGGDEELGSGRVPRLCCIVHNSAVTSGRVDGETGAKRWPDL